MTTTVIRRFRHKPPAEELVGEVWVDVVLENPFDSQLVRLGVRPEGTVRRFEWPMLVDTGATTLVLPEEAAEALGLNYDGTVDVQFANGSVGVLPIARAVLVSIQGRSATTDAIVAPAGSLALLGQIPLEAMDLLVDCKLRRLVPRDPSGPTYIA